MPEEALIEYDLVADPVEATGGITMSGASGLFTRYFYVPQGTIYTGSIGYPDAFPLIYFELESEWNVKFALTMDFSSSWNIGEQRMHWYRVQGACKPLTCPPVSVEEQCKGMMFLMNVLAPNLQSVCRQLKNRQFVQRIAKIQKFSRPARPSDQAADAAIGIDHSCNKLEDVSFCNVPACLDFCVDYDEVVSVGLRTFKIEPEIAAQFIQSEKEPEYPVLYVYEGGS